MLKKKRIKIWIAAELILLSSLLCGSAMFTKTLLTHGLYRDLMIQSAIISQIQIGQSVKDVCENLSVSIGKSSNIPVMENIILESRNNIKIKFQTATEMLYPVLKIRRAASYDMTMVAQMVQAEAGNQDLEGMRLVADVILNRVDSPLFPNSVLEVLSQKGQFGPMTDGAYEKAAADVTETVYQAVEMEWDKKNRLDSEVIYFNGTWDNGVNPFKHGDHWFSY